MRITSHPLRGSAATTALRSSAAFDPNLSVHLRFVELDDVAFITAVSPGPSRAARRQWILQYKLLEAQGSEFNFVIVENGRDTGLVRMNDFVTIGGEASFGWGNFIAPRPGLLTATALAIYSLGFDALGFARAHMMVPKTSPDMAAFHVSTGAELEFDDGYHRYFRYRAETYNNIRDEAMRQRTVIVPETA